VTWADLLNIAIVLAVVYLMIAVVGSWLIEAAATLLGSRARMLRSGIGELLGDPKFKGIAAQVIKHPLVTSLPSGRSGPSYIDSHLFAMALRDIVNRAGGFAGRPLASPVAALLRNSADATAFFSNVEQWFDTCMERLSGVYKRWTQLWLLLVSLAIAVSWNIDTVQLCEALTKMPSDSRASLATTMAQTAAAVEAKSSSPPASSQASEAKSRSPSASSQAAEVLLALKLRVPLQHPGEGSNWALKILGWVITALAGSLGSTFWFNVLQESLRLTGRKPIVTSSNKPDAGATL
jgi:hypothetical protein